MPQTNDREYRNMVLEVRKIEDDTDNDMIVTGYASTFNEPYTLYEMDDWRLDEIVDARAFDNTDMSDVIMQYDHEGRVFARISNDTLKVAPDERGLLIEANLGGTELGRQLYEEIRGGYTNKMSFGFIVDGDEIVDSKDENGKDVTTRTITSVRKLYDVSAVSLPANDATSISVRSLTNGEIERIRAERLEAEKLELRRRKIKAKAELIGVMNLDIEAVEARSLALATEIDAAESNEAMDAIQTEISALEERKAQIKAEIETRKENIADIVKGEGVVVEKIEERAEKEMFGIDSKEYRDAFMANLVGRATVEQRAILADNTTYGDGLSLPVGLDREIWDQVSSAHPILADVDILRSGIAIKVTKMTPAAVTKKMDSANSTEQTFTGVDVTLVGADYHTYVTLSYAEAKMSQGAMERFLVNEIANALGESLAKDVFARILSDAGNAQKVTPASGSTVFENVKLALALATQGNPVVYAPASSYYEIVGAIQQGSPFNIGAALGVEVKKDNAATKITVVDPKLFVLNVIQDTLIEYIERGNYKKDSEVYKKAGLSRQVWSQIMHRSKHTPSRSTIFPLILALQLSFEDATRLLASAGLAFNYSNPVDCIVRKQIEKKNYNVMKVNYLLEEAGLDPFAINSIEFK